MIAYRWHCLADLLAHLRDRFTCRVFGACAVTCRGRDDHRGREAGVP